jgi:hypothetical protein
VRDKVLYGGVAEIVGRDATMDCMVLNISEQGANKVGLAFRMMTSDAPVSDLDERLRRSEIKKRQLQRRINELLGER